jgi:hypothetical protein
LGCASIGMRDGGHAAASIWHRQSQSHLAPVEQVRLGIRCRWKN